MLSTIIPGDFKSCHSFYFFLPQLFCIFLYDFFVTVDFFLLREVPFFFFALILFTNEFFTPSLFFFAPLFLGADLSALFFAGFRAVFFAGLRAVFFVAFFFVDIIHFSLCVQYLCPGSNNSYTIFLNSYQIDLIRELMFKIFTH